MLGCQRKIFAGKVNFPICLAPMVGLSHQPMRAVLQSYLPEGAKTIWPSEMLNSRRIPNEDVGRTPETLSSEKDHFFVPQILGNEEISIQKTLEKLEEWGVHGVDINMGCPVRKALKHNYGVALMGDIQYASEVVSMTTKHARFPVSVKLRMGMSNDREFLKEFSQGLIQSGASWLTLHPRTAEQKRRGRADWDQIGWLRDQIDVPLIGNGDIQCAEDITLMLQQTHCDLVMAGRALAAKPWLLWQWGEDNGWSGPPGRANEMAPRTAEQEGHEYGRAFLMQIDGFKQSPVKEGLALRKLMFFLRSTHMWLTYGHRLYSESSKAQTLDALKLIAVDFFSRPQALSKRTHLLN